MSAEDKRKMAEEANQAARLKINEYAEKAADEIEDNISAAKWGYTSQRFGGGMHQYDVPEIVEGEVAPKVFEILISRGYKVEFKYCKGPIWKWNTIPDYLGPFTLSWG